MGTGQVNHQKIKAKMQTSTEMNHNNNIYQHFLNTCYMPDTVQKPLRRSTHGIFTTILRDELFIIIILIFFFFAETEAQSY